MTMSEPRTSTVIRLDYQVETIPEAWELPEVPVPESRPHDLTLDYLKALLAAWIARTSRDAIVARNLAVRWLPDHPRVGVDPDLCLIEPAPPDADELTSLCLWRPGHIAPLLAIEVVSRNHPYKDYVDVQDKYAACGIGELWVLDPWLLGPRALGGPAPLQIWRRDPSGAFVRAHHGSGPVFSDAIGSWVRVENEHVVVSDDAFGRARWRTQDELTRERAEVAESRAEVAESRAAELERRLAELERGKHE